MLGKKLCDTSLDVADRKQNVDYTHKVRGTGGLTPGTGLAFWDLFFHLRAGNLLLVTIHPDVKVSSLLFLICLRDFSFLGCIVIQLHLNTYTSQHSFLKF